MENSTWVRERNFVASDFTIDAIKRRTSQVSVCIPTLNEAATIGPIVSCLAQLREAGALDELVVVDGDSTDGTAEIAAAAGATVHAQASLLPSFGPILGKGDAMWRALSVLSGDLVCFFDGDLNHFNREYFLGLLGPLIAVPDVLFVKATFDRPFAGSDVGDEAGRVTQAAARPLLDMFYPELRAFHQPLAGQIAVRRSFMRSVPISTGYGVDVGLLIDAFKLHGLTAIAQVDIGTVYNRHRGLEDLGVIAHHVHQAVFARLADEGRVASPSLGPFIQTTEDGTPSRAVAQVVQRPPLVSVTG
jgi:glucosyl-3-phosphoglycerate synthase